MWIAPRTWVTGEFVSGFKWNTSFRDNIKETWRRLELVNSGASVSPTAVYLTNNGTTIVTFSSFTFNVTDPVRIEIWSTLFLGGGPALYLGITDGAPGTSPMVFLGQAFPRRCNVYSGSFLSPSAGSHAFRVAGWVSSTGTATVTHPFQGALWQKNGPVNNDEIEAN